jgi:hypothetical protein
MGFNSSTQTVNITGNVTAVAAVHSPNVWAQGEGNATTTLYTVPAGKKARVLNCYCGVTGGATAGRSAIVANGKYLIQVIALASAGQGASANASYNYADAYEIAAGNTVQFVSNPSATNNSIYGVMIYEEAV